MNDERVKPQWKQVEVSIPDHSWQLDSLGNKPKALELVNISEILEYLNICSFDIISVKKMVHEYLVSFSCFEKCDCVVVYHPEIQPFDDPKIFYSDNYLVSLEFDKFMPNYVGATDEERRAKDLMNVVNTGLNSLIGTPMPTLLQATHVVNSLEEGTKAILDITNNVIFKTALDVGHNIDIAVGNIVTRDTVSDIGSIVGDVISTTLYNKTVMNAASYVTGFFW